MNKYIYIFISICLIKFSFSQTNIYYPFPEQNAEWNVSQFSSTTCKSIKYLINGADTIFQSNTYHKITKTEVSYAVFTNGTCNFNNIINVITDYAGAIRNDSLAKKVYYVIPNTNTDTLLFDFSLNVGDTIKTYIASTCSNRKVLYIDSVLIGGIYHKRLNTTECYFGGQNVQFIEGVGSNLGLIERIPSIGIYNTIGSLNCFSKNAQSQYPTSSTSNCPLITSVKNYNSEINEQVFINSFNKTINIKQESNSYKNYIICSITGNVISKGKIENSDMTINLNEVTDGIYLLSLLGKEKTLVKKIVVVE